MCNKTEDLSDFLKTEKKNKNSAYYLPLNELNL